MLWSEKNTNVRPFQTGFYLGHKERQSKFYKRPRNYTDRNIESGGQPNIETAQKTHLTDTL